MLSSVARYQLARRWIQRCGKSVPAAPILQRLSPVASMSTSGGDALTGMSPLAAAPNATPSASSNTVHSSGKTKPRYSRQQKRDRQSHRQQDQQGPTDSTSRPYLPEPHGPNPSQQQQQQQQHKRSKPCPKPPLTWQDRIFQCIRDAERTGSIAVEGHGPPPPLPFQRNYNNSNSFPPPSPPLNCIRVVTTSGDRSQGGDGMGGRQQERFPPHNNRSPGHLTVRVQPLLILDLNGILCHRSRKQKEPPGVQLRQPFLGNVAGTPVVSRTDLVSFLRMVDRYFCLAVWTSAKMKTARGLLRILFPPDIQRRLLFVWAQDHCERVLPTAPSNSNESNDDDDGGDQVVGLDEQRVDTNQQQQQPQQPYYYKGEDIIFEKRLDKVWRAFPLWNANNTLLMDDSPDKCPFAAANAIHPPPLHGQWRPPLTTDASATSTMPWIPDEQNEEQQYDFFQRYIHHWHEYPYTEYLTETTVPSLLQPTTRASSSSSSLGGNEVDVVPVKEVITNQSLYDFLRLYGSGHMGWRGYNG